MTEEMTRIVIAGGSTAGISAAQALREDGFAGDIDIIEPETDIPYDRTRLSKDFLAGRASINDLSLLTDDELHRLNVRWHLGCRASGLDLDRRRVALSNGQTMPFTGLIIATGSSPRPLPGAERAPDGVRLLRSLGDAQRLRAQLEHAEHLLLIGAGFIGLELAAVALERDLPVTIIESDAAPLARTLGSTVGTAIAAHHQNRGARLLTGRQVVAWRGERTLTGAVLDNRAVVHADLAVVGIGAVPNTSWLTDGRLMSLNGVPCDETLATGVAGVVAAGDVACWPHPAAARAVRVEHYEHAVLSGAHAARRLLHGAGMGAYAAMPTVFSHQGPHTIHAIGFPDARLQTRVIEGALNEEAFAVAYEQHGQTVGAVTLNLPRTYRRLRRELALQGALA